MEKSHDGTGGVEQKGSRVSFSVERSVCYAERPGFRIQELHINPRQEVPWHYHTEVRDTFYVLQGHLRIFLRDPEQDIRLAPRDTFAVAARRPHRVTNAGEGCAIFFVLQDGAYDFVPVE